MVLQMSPVRVFRTFPQNKSAKLGSHSGSELLPESSPSTRRAYAVPMAPEVAAPVLEVDSEDDDRDCWRDELGRLWMRSGSGTCSTLAPACALPGRSPVRVPGERHGVRLCDHAAAVPAVLRVRHLLIPFIDKSVEHSCFATETGIRSASLHVRGALRSPVMDVPVITQLLFLQYFEDVEVPQIPSLTECYRFQMYYRVVYVQCKLCRNRRCHSPVLGQVVLAPVVMLRQLLGVGQCRFGAVLGGYCHARCSCDDRCLCWSRQCRITCPSLCNDRCRMVETVQKTVESPQLVLLLDKVVDVPLLATLWGSRGSAVAVHRLVCQLIMAMMRS